MPEYKLPDVGEGLTEAEIVTWKVKVGDVIAINDIVVEIETAKSLVELPSPYAGTVTALLVPEGETVAVGTPIIAIGDAASAVRPRRRPPHPRPRARSTCPTPPPAAAARARAWSAATRPSATPMRRPRAGVGSPAAAAAEQSTQTQLQASFDAGRLAHRPRSSRPTSRPCRRTPGAESPGAPRDRRRPHARQAAGAQAGQGPRRRPRPR